MSAVPEIAETERLEAAADAAIATCGGNLRMTVKSLILANEFLELETERFRVDAEMWRDATSTGYTRGRARRSAKGCLARH